MQKLRRHFILLILTGGACLAQDIVRYGFQPPVIPETMTEPVVFEAQATGSFTGIAFELDGADLPLRDDGVSPDRVANDGIYAIAFEAAKITGKLTAERVFRPFLGYLKLFDGANVIFRLNVFTEVWTNDIPIVQVDTLDAEVLAAPNVVNMQGTLPLGGFDARPWAQKFYTYFKDEYDFFNFVFIPAIRGNRYHFAVQNQTTGLGLSIFDNSAQYGSSGKLQGISVFPISTLFDGAEATYQHELGHQWINFLHGTPFESGIPHWPLSSVASGMMGISLAGGVGGRFPYKLIPEGPNYRLESITGQPVFNDLELYLMGLLPADSVSTHFVFDNQNQTPQAGGLLLGPVTSVAIADLISLAGARNPAAAGSQKKFRLATVVISEELLSVEAISFFNYFSERTELREQVPFASGFATGTAIPFYLATGGRGELDTKIGARKPNLSNRILRVPAEFATIQSAIDAAAKGDTVLVAAGSYAERLTIDQEIVLLSESGPDSTAINSSGFGNNAGSWVVLTLANCTVSGFTLVSDDPFTFGVSCATYSPVIENNVIENLSFSGIFCTQGSPIIRRNLIKGCQQNGIIMNTNATPQIINNTIVENSAGIVAFVNSNPAVKNNIIANNSGRGLSVETGSTMQNTYNDVWGQNLDYFGGLQAGTGEISADPRFVGGQPFDYHLQAGSACINAGDPASSTDPDGTRADMGAYPYDLRTSVTAKVPQPESFVLHRNFPNPFNPATVISYQLSAASEVRLTVYDQLGKAVVTLVRGTQPTGQYQVLWDGRNAAGQQVASGVYLYRLQTGSFVQTRKMLLMR